MSSDTTRRMKPRALCAFTAATAPPAFHPALYTAQSAALHLQEISFEIPSRSRLLSIGFLVNLEDIQRLSHEASDPAVPCTAARIHKWTLVSKSAKRYVLM
jgi:hypothetical protein